MQAASSPISKYTIHGKKGDPKTATEQQIKELEKELKYSFNGDGVLINKITSKKPALLDEQTYEKCSSYGTIYVQSLLKMNYNLTTILVPIIQSNKDAPNKQKKPQCEILVSDNFKTKEKCLILLQGTGAVRPGIWARSVCINEGLDTGSMIPFVDWALKNEFSVLIMNPNEREGINGGKINEFNNSNDHCLYVYKKFVYSSKVIKKINFVSHSNGGKSTIHIISKFNKELTSGRINKIAFTDSNHGSDYKSLNEKAQKELGKRSRDYVTSKEPCGKLLVDWKKSKNGVSQYSAGHNKHEYTTGKAKEEIFKFFREENKNLKGK